MKKSLLLIPITIALAIFFYPTTSNSYATGSPGGKTNSPNDASNCTGCHSGTINSGIGTANITTNIPASGYSIGSTYTITLTGIKASCTKFGFEITAENWNSKSGNFMITDNTTKLVNTNNAVTHKSSGTSGITTKSWTMDWKPTANSNENTIFYAAIMFANANSNNNGDNIISTSLSVDEEVANGINDNTFENSFHYNSINKTIESINSTLVYNINGKLVLSTKKKLSTVSHLKKGIYILKSKNRTQKIILY